MVYGYCRVSSRQQFCEGNGLEVQQQEILSRYEHAELVNEQHTGKTIDRPLFNDLIIRLEKNDTLVVTKLDRLARNTIEGIEIVEKLFDKGVSVHVLNVGLLENTTMGKFFITTLLAVSEMERSTIIERTQAGKEVAKTKAGYKEGRPNKYTKIQIDHAVEMLESKSYTQVVAITGISKSTLIREVRNRQKLGGTLQI